MPRKAKPLSFEEHVLVGQWLKQINNLLFQSSDLLFSRFPKTSLPVQEIARVHDHLDRLRYELDNLISLHCPSRTNEELNRVYYGDRSPFGL